jgi:hypothetical protein
MSANAEKSRGNLVGDTSKLLIMGPEATTAIMTAFAVAPLAGRDLARYAAAA